MATRVYVDHVLYRTVGTPTDLSGTGAPDHTYDAIYGFADQPSVAEAAPGDPGHNGGRWQVHSVHAALESGHARDAGTVSEFVCTVNNVPASRA